MSILMRRIKQVSRSCIKHKNEVDYWLCDAPVFKHGRRENQWYNRKQTANSSIKNFTFTSRRKRELHGSQHMFSVYGQRIGIWRRWRLEFTSLVFGDVGSEYAFEASLSVILFIYISCTSNWDQMQIPQFQMFSCQPTLGHCRSMGNGSERASVCCILVVEMRSLFHILKFLSRKYLNHKNLRNEDQNTGYQRPAVYRQEESSWRLSAKIRL